MKKKKWNTTKLIATGSMGVLNILFALFGSIIVVVTGIPLSSGVINVFIGGILFAFNALLIKKFGASIIMGTTFSVIALPLPLNGLPGFFPKLIVGPVVGLIADSIYLIFRRQEKIVSFLIGGSTQLCVGLIVIGLGTIFNLSGLTRLLEVFPLLLIIIGSFCAGGLSGILGWLIYKKVEKSTIVKRIQR